jgi:CRP-like cAMP-binding protein
LANAEPQTLAAFAALCTYIELPADCLVYEQTMDGSSMYLLLSGRVMFWIDSLETRGMTLGYLTAPHHFGELCFLCPGQRTTNVTTCTEVQLLRINASDVSRMASICPAFVRTITATVVERCRGNVELLQNTVFRTAKERVMNALLLIARESQGSLSPGSSGAETPPSGDGFVVTRGYTHEDIARIAVTTRETVSRVLGELARAGAADTSVVGCLRVRPATIQALLDAGTLEDPRPGRSAAVWPPHAGLASLS